MCEANVYFVDKRGNDKLLLESVDKIVSTEDGLLKIAYVNCPNGNY